MHRKSDIVIERERELGLAIYRRRNQQVDDCNREADGDGYAIIV